jgi:UDP-glucose 4-epimerase
VAQDAAGVLGKLNIYGNDYDTSDGTGVRDYLHVMDLAIGHLKALAYIRERKGAEAINLGTGTGYSVLDVVSAFERASGKKIPYQISARRPGDIATCYADAAKAEKVLGWTAERGLDEMCADAWRFTQKTYCPGSR